MPPSKQPDRLLVIVDAATEVFARSGYANAQMADIARQAGVSVGTLYNYVEGKAALLLLCAERPFVDIAAGRELPVPTPDRAELIARLDATLQRHVQIPALDAARAGSLEPADLGPTLAEIVGELFDLIATTRVAADAMERSARDAPDLGELFYRRVRVRLLDQLTALLRRVHEMVPPPAPITADVDARFVLETVTWWARHRHRDPAPPALDEASAREVAIALAGSVAVPRPTIPSDQPHGTGA